MSSVIEPSLSPLTPAAAAHAAAAASKSRVQPTTPWEILATSSAELAGALNLEQLVNRSLGIIVSALRPLEAETVLKKHNGDFLRAWGSADTRPFKPEPAFRDAVRRATESQATEMYRSDSDRSGVIPIASTAEGDVLLWLVAPQEEDAVVCGIGASLTAQTTALSASMQNFTMLESLVTSEMKSAVERESFIRLILDSMEDGLIVCGLDGQLQVRSASILRWFGDADGLPVWDYLLGAGTDQAALFELGWMQLLDGFLPFSVAASQLARRIERDGRHVDLEVSPIERDGVTTELLFKLHDVTAHVQAMEQAERSQEAADLIGRVLEDRRGFQDGLDFLGGLLDNIEAAPTLEALRGHLHNAKGSSACLGFRIFPHACHAMEDAVEDATALPSPESLTGLRQVWQQSLDAVAVFLKQDDRLCISDEDYASLLQGLAHESRDALEAQVREWTKPRIRSSLELLATRAERIALRENKRLEVIIADNGLKLPSPELRPMLFALSHVVNNAVRHGIERPQQRQAAGKAASGKIRLTAARERDTLVLQVEDDGRGIDRTHLLEQAQTGDSQVGPHTTLLELLATDGLSSNEGADEVSGRGLGVGIVLGACRSLGGQAELDSKDGQYCRWTFRIPLHHDTP